jgi:hypothetical protein
VRENKVEGKQKKELESQSVAHAMPCHNVIRCVQAKKGSGWKIWDERESLDVDRVWERRS